MFQHHRRQRMQRVLLAAIAGIALATTASPARAAPDDMAPEGSVRIGIVVLSTVGVTYDEALAEAERMGKALGTRLLIDVEIGTRERLAKRPSPNCITDAGCIHGVGTALDVKELLFLAVVRIGPRLQISVTWADAATGTTHGREPIRIEEGEDDQAIFANAATTLLPEVAVRPEVEVPNDDQVEPPPLDTGTAMDPTTGPIDEPGGRRMTTGAWIASGVGVLALAGGTTLGVMALSAEGKLEEDCNDGGCPDALESRKKSINRQAFAADALFATALVSGVVAGVLYWRSGKSEPSGLAVHTTPTSVGFSYSASF